MKATSDHFRCDLCGKYRSLGVTESHEPSGGHRFETTICVQCIRDASVLLLDGLIAVGGTPMEDAPSSDDAPSTP